MSSLIVQTPQHSQKNVTRRELRLSHEDLGQLVHFIPLPSHPLLLLPLLPLLLPAWWPSWLSTSSLLCLPFTPWPPYSLLPRIDQNIRIKLKVFIMRRYGVREKRREQDFVIFWLRVTTKFSRLQDKRLSPGYTCDGPSP